MPDTMDENRTALEDITVKFQNMGTKRRFHKLQGRKNVKSPSKDPELEVTLELSLLTQKSRSSNFIVLEKTMFNID